MIRTLPSGPVFSRVAARQLGWSDSALTRAVVAGRLVRVRRGYLARPDGPPDAAGAAAAACRGAVVSHLSALQRHDLPVVGRRPRLPELTVPPTGLGSLAGTHLHRAGLPLDDVVEIDGTLVTSVARTLVDVARSCPLTTTVAAMDAALHRDLVTYDDIEAVVLECWNWPGIRRVHRPIELSDGRAESPLESVSRLVIGRLRLPEPLLQPLVLDENDVALARLDFYWDEFGVAGEADGRGKYDGRDILTREKNRQELVEDLGLPFVRWGWADTGRPPQLRSRIERAFRRGAARDRSGLPREWSIRPAQPVGREENVTGTRVRAARPRASP